MKNRPNYLFRTSLLLLVGTLVLEPRLVSTEFICSQEVTYRWAKLSVSTEPKEGNKTSEAPKPEEKMREATIHWGTYQQTGEDEAAAKEKLEPFVTRERKRASEACRELHENYAGCLATKYSAHNAELVTIDFSARKALHEAIEQDCKAQQGKCLEIAVSEPKCSEKKKPEDAAAAAGDGKKDDKAKKKK